MAKIIEVGDARLVTGRNGGWYMTWYDAEAGYSRRRSLRTSDKATARKRAADLQSAKRPVVDPEKVKLSDVLRAYHTDAYNKGRSTTRQILAAQTQLMRHLGDITVAGFRRPAQEAWIDAMERAGLSQSTRSVYASTVSAALRYAVSMELVSSAPTVAKVKAGQPRERWLTHDEAARLLSVAGNLAGYVAVALLTGARPLTLFEMTWAQVSFGTNRLHLNPPQREQTSKRRPTIVMSQALNDTLKDLWKDAPDPDGLVFPGSSGRGFGRIDRPFAAARGKAMLGDDVLPYTLRHTTATWLAMEGVPMNEISAYMGHTDQSAKMTQVYVHHTGYGAEAAAGMDRAWAKVKSATLRGDDASGPPDQTPD